MSTLSTFATPPTKPRRASATADSVIAAAIDIARQAALDVAGAADVGDHEGVRAEGQRLATHYFRSTAPGYRGWRWAVTMARAPRAKSATVCEVALLSGDDSIVAPPWMPWSERLQPGDVGRDDVLPFSPDDSRLMQGFEATGDVDVDELAIVELGLGRPRVLSPEGRTEATTRWYSGDHGPIKATTGGSGGRGDRRDGPLKAQCSTCGFLMLMAGSVRTVFGVCANEWSPDDGHVVSMDHGCGAHSETDVKHTGSDWPDKAPVIDEGAVELFDHRAEPGSSQGKRAGEGGSTESPATDGASAGEVGPDDGQGVDEVGEAPAEAAVPADGGSADGEIGGADSDSVSAGASTEHGDPDERGTVGHDAPEAQVDDNAPAQGEADVAEDRAAADAENAPADEENAPADEENAPADEENTPADQAANAESTQTEP